MSQNSKFDNSLSVTSGDPLTIEFLRTMVHNENHLNITKLGGLLRNVRGPLNKSGRNKPRHKPAKKLLDNNLLLFSVIEDFNFGSSAPFTGSDNKTFYRRIKSQGTEYRWPSKVVSGSADPNTTTVSIFSPEYQPVVVMTLLNTPGVNLPDLYITPERITTKWLEFRVCKARTDASDPKAGATDKFWVSIMAMGVKNEAYWNL